MVSEENGILCVDTNTLQYFVSLYVPSKAVAQLTSYTIYFICNRRNFTNSKSSICEIVGYYFRHPSIHRCIWIRTREHIYFVNIYQKLETSNNICVSTRNAIQLIACSFKWNALGTNCYSYLCVEDWNSEKYYFAMRNPSERINWRLKI